MSKLVLASASPGRLMVLKESGIIPDLVDAQDVDESILPRETPRDYVTRVAHLKAQTAHTKHPDAFVIAADTTVALGRRIFCKTDDREEARAIISRLMGRTVWVLTAMTVISPDGKVCARLSQSRVKVARLNEEELKAYLDYGEWKGKAGSFSISGRGGVFITHASGSYSGIIGIPVHDVYTALKGMGYFKDGKTPFRG